MPATTPSTALSHAARRSRPLYVFVFILVLLLSAAGHDAASAAGAVRTAKEKVKAKALTPAQRRAARKARARSRRPARSERAAARPVRKRASAPGVKRETYAAPAQPAGEQSAPRTAGADFYGINPGDLFKLPTDRWDGELAAIAASGIQTVRMGAWWSDLEPAPPVGDHHTYAWSELDERVAALARHGLRWEPLLSFSATWASQVPGDYTAAPAEPAFFAKFAAALTQRFGRGGTFWAEHPELPQLPVTSYEIWNEQNAALHWHPAENVAERYADLYVAARSAMRQVDGAARVTVGGLAAPGDRVMPADEFLRRMYAHRPDLRGNVDAVGYHPYARDVAGVYTHLAAFRRALDEVAGPGVPIAITEIGWTTVDTDEQRRAEYLAELATTLPRSDCGVDRMMPYAWIGAEQAGDDREQWFGIRNRDATPKPSATAYAGAVRQMRGLAGTPPTGDLAVCAAQSRPAAPAAAPPASLKLAVSVRQDRRRPGRLLLSARCAKGCRLQVAVTTPRGRRHVRVARRTLQLGGRGRTVALPVPRRLHRHGTRLRVDVVASASHGRRESRSRTVRLRTATPVSARRA